jgi:TetR/AcrR family transcriptional regulator
MMSAATQSKRERDAEAARQAILDAAEKIFAEHGFDGARVDAIAAESGYNKSLLFQYFGDKLGLYTEVLRRSDRELNEVQARIFAPWLEDETIVTDAYRLKPLLESMAAALFDYFVEHPRLMRMLLWEMAEGWKTYTKIIPQFETEDLGLFERLLRKAHSAGLLRTDFAPVIQLTMFLQICQTYLAFLPLYQMFVTGEDLTSDAALARARKYIVDLLVAGMMKDIPEAKP